MFFESLETTDSDFVIIEKKSICYILTMLTKFKEVIPLQFLTNHKDFYFYLKTVSQIFDKFCCYYLIEFSLFFIFLQTIIEIFDMFINEQKTLSKI